MKKLFLYLIHWQFLTIDFVVVLDPLMKTDLATIPEKYFPLTSLGPRERNVSMATYILSQLRIALNMDTQNYPDNCDCVIMKGIKR